MENLPIDYIVNLMAFTKQTYRDVYPAIDPSLPSNSQAGKVIVITGASRGIGRSGFAASFAKANPKGIVLVAKTADSLEVVSKEIHAIDPNIEVLPIATDISRAESVVAMWEKVKTKFSHADVLVNNAGTLSEVSPVKDADAGKWWHDFEVNAHGTFLVTQGFLKLLGEKKGTVINLTSAAATTVYPDIGSSYSLSKLISLQLVSWIAVENPNVTAIALHPGMVLTDMTIESVKRFNVDTPELVGGVGVWLSTEKARFLGSRYMNANWSVEELVERKDEIIGGNKLTIALVGKFGSKQFV